MWGVSRSGGSGGACSLPAGQAPGHMCVSLIQTSLVACQSSLIAVHLAATTNSGRACPPACRYCAARGAYRGAGRELLSRLLHLDLSAGEGLLAAGSIMQEEQRRQQAQSQDGSGLAAGGGDGGSDGWCEGEEGAGVGSADEEELAAAVRQLAEMAVLGLGDADRLFPASLDEHYSSMSDELAFRVAL